MLTPKYSLKAILNAFSKTTKQSDPKQRVKKRTLFNNAAVGGINSRYIKLFFLSLPFIEYAAIFNPTVFNYLGIAQSIVFFIVFLSIVMMLIFIISWKNNQIALNKMSTSWESYFPDVDLKMVLSSGVTPYRDFFVDYSQISAQNLDDADLQNSLRSAFNRMQDENRDLLEAMQRDQQSKQS